MIAWPDDEREDERERGEYERRSCPVDRNATHERPEDEGREEEGGDDE